MIVVCPAGGGVAAAAGAAAAAAAASSASGGGAASSVTICSLLDISVPASFALARSRCTASINSVCCARNASPSFWVQSSFSSIIARTSGNVAIDFTLGSQSMPLSASAMASPFNSGLALLQRAASTISSGYVDDIKTCASRGSGYSAIGEAICSSSSVENVPDLAGLAAAGWFGAWAAGGVAGAGACCGDTAVATSKAAAAPSDVTAQDLRKREFMGILILPATLLPWRFPTLIGL